MIQQALNVQSTIQEKKRNASLQIFYIECLALWKCVFVFGVIDFTAME